MHIVALAWLFVVATTALTLSSPARGLAFFAAASAPLLLYACVVARRRRAARRSMLEHEVRERDGAEPEADQ